MLHSLIAWLSLSPPHSPHSPCSRPLTRDKPCPPLTPAEEGGGTGGPLSPTKAWMAQGSTHSLGEQEIFVPGGEGWREREGELEREEKRDTNTIWAYILFITLCNMHQKNWYPKQGCRDSRGMSSCKIFSSWLRGQTNSLSDLSSCIWWKELHIKIESAKTGPATGEIYRLIWIHIDFVIQ